MDLPIKHSVALVVRKDSLVLVIRRPDDDDELPGIWGLPAGTFRDNETIVALVHRIGQQKLGVSLSPLRKLSSGFQARKTYRLEMELWEAAMEGSPDCPHWKWAEPDVLIPGQKAGSLCCDLALRSAGS